MPETTAPFSGVPGLEVGTPRIIDGVNKHENNKGTMSPEPHKRLSIEELRSLVEPLAKKYGVGRVYLFGSVARGDDSEDSDYDFCIEPGKIEDLFTLSGFFGDLNDAIGHEIDLVTIESLPREFLNNIMNEGVILYE